MIIDYLIKAKNKQSEGDVCVLLYQKLDDNNVDFKTEVKLPKSIVGSRGCRFDILVYYHSYPIAIIEVKRKEGSKAITQSEYYTKVTGLPVFVCGGFSEVDEVIQRVLNLLNEHRLGKKS